MAMRANSFRTFHGGPRPVLLNPTPDSVEMVADEGTFFRGLFFAVPLGLAAWAGLGYLVLKLLG